MGNIYFTSDLHFCHNKEFLYGKRGFKNQYEMNEVIISNWNKIITNEDDVYVLGDLVLSDTQMGLSCIRQLNGNIHIIRGNHDSEDRISEYNNLYNVVEICEGKYFKFGKYRFFLSHYPCLTSNHDEDKSLYKRMINLCGHAHTPDRWSDFDKGLIYHVELDAHNITPIKIEDIILDIKNKLGEK